MALGGFVSGFETGRKIVRGFEEEGERSRQQDIAGIKQAKEFALPFLTDIAKDNPEGLDKAAALLIKQNKRLGGQLSRQNIQEDQAIAILTNMARQQAKTSLAERQVQVQERGITLKEKQFAAKAISDLIKQKKDDPEIVKSLTSFRSLVLKDKSIEAASTAIRAAEPVLALINSGNPIAGSAVKIQLPRLMGEVGNLTKAEQDAFSGSRAALSRVDQFLTTISTGTISPENEKFLKSIVQILEGVAVRRGNERIDKFVKSQEALGISSEKIKAVIDPFKFKMSSIKERQTQPSIPPAGTPDPTSQQQGAIDFVRNNPNDPRSNRIRSELNKIGIRF